MELGRLIRRSNSRSAEVVLEGIRTIGEAIDAGMMPTTVVIAESDLVDTPVQAVFERLDAGVEVVVVRDHVFAKLAPSVSPQPMLALVSRPEASIPDTAASGDVVLVLLEVSDPGNMGTLIRLADAMAARAVVVVSGADPWGAKAVRSSAGSILRVPVSTALDADQALKALKALSAAGYRVVATDAKRGEPHDGGVLASPVAIVLGSEAHGLDPSIDPLVDAWATIEMPGLAESLNVAMAGTLLMYEAARR